MSFHMKNKEKKQHNGIKTHTQTDTSNENRSTSRLKDQQESKQIHIYILNY